VRDPEVDVTLRHDCRCCGYRLGVVSITADRKLLVPF